MFLGDEREPGVYCLEVLSSSDADVRCAAYVGKCFGGGGQVGGTRDFDLSAVEDGGVEEIDGWEVAALGVGAR